MTPDIRKRVKPIVERDGSWKTKLNEGQVRGHQEKGHLLTNASELLAIASE